MKMPAAASKEASTSAMMSLGQCQCPGWVIATITTTLPPTTVAAAAEAHSILFPSLDDILELLQVRHAQQPCLLPRDVRLMRPHVLQQLLGCLVLLHRERQVCPGIE